MKQILQQVIDYFKYLTKKKLFTNIYRGQNCMNTKLHEDNFATRVIFARE